MTWYQPAPYREFFAVNHSGMKELDLGHRPLPEHVFLLGSVMHAILEGQPVPDNLQAQAMADAINNAMANLLRGATLLKEHEIYRIFAWRFGIPFWSKAKVDGLIRGLLVMDYKSTDAKTEEQFIKKCKALDYFKQLVRYMYMANVPYGLIIGVCKNPDANGVHRVFIIKITSKMELYQHYLQQVHADNARWLEAMTGQINW